ncbi:hypothetical protein COG00_001112 [Escherichia coli]|nr:hypothetical protein [Escherichia coli]EFD3825859.1 hypothetical protein [Escherichia coli]EIN1156366.1 hypothetical protein [Escherichia coli]
MAGTDAKPQAHRVISHQRETMSINDYRAFLETGALIEKDQHGFVRCALSGEMLAVNPEQIDALIEFLKGIRD